MHAGQVLSLRQHNSGHLQPDTYTLGAISCLWGEANLCPPGAASSAGAGGAKGAGSAAERSAAALAALPARVRGGLRLRAPGGPTASLHNMSQAGHKLVVRLVRSAHSFNRSLVLSSASCECTWRYCPIDASLPFLPPNHCLSVTLATIVAVVENTCGWEQGCRLYTFQ
jgi:hypothetical protein